MEQNRIEVEKYINEIRRTGEYFIGPNVHSNVLRCKYPNAWIETLRRYVELINEAGDASVYSQFYLDLCVTVLTKRIIAVDIHHIIGADDKRQKKEIFDMRIIHAIMFKMSLSRLLSCLCECLLRGSSLSDDEITVALAAKLYERVEFMLKEKYYKNEEDGKYYAREKLNLPDTVHSLVYDWLISEVLPKLCVREKGKVNLNAVAILPTGLRKTKVLSSSHLSFFGVSHCFWLWLHLTAAGIQTAKAENDFLTAFYAFDLFIYCPQCSAHFVKHRDSVFYTREPYTVSVRTAYTARSIVYNMHNVVNQETGKEVLPPSVMTDYAAYWQRYRLTDAGN